MRNLSYISLLALYILLASAVFAQDAGDSDEVAGNAENAAQAPTDDDDPKDSVEINDESYLDIDEEDFTPSEEIPTDQSITFPTDI